jgi:hypothetical protein
MLSRCYQIAVDKELGVIVISFQGKIYPKDMVEMLGELFDHQDYRLDFPTVYDFSGSAAIGYQIDVMAFVKRLGQYRSSTSLHKRIGVIVKTPNQKFLINVFLKFAPSFNLELKVFDEAKPCVTWIKEGADDQEKLCQLLKANKEELAKRLDPLV